MTTDRNESSSLVSDVGECVVSVLDEPAEHAEDGDRRILLQLGDRVVLVYGSAPAEDLDLVVERLTTEPR